MRVKLTSEKVNVNYFGVIKEGWYISKISNVEITTSKNNNKMLVVEFELIEESRGGRIPFAGHKIKKYLLLEDKYIGAKLYELLKLCDIDVKDGDEIDVEKLVEGGQLLNIYVDAEIIEDTYTNKDGKSVICNRINYIHAIDYKDYRKKVEDVVINDDDIPF